ncbi:MAG TPA: DUF2760 domain-containing protein [Candidatus Acidoferrum sp.]|nr:DUF2760 domain-containing protein [Candidatus Acidoferrum sp.]
MPGFSRRIVYAVRCFIAVLIKGEIPKDILQALATSAAQVPSPPTPAPMATASPAAVVPQQSSDLDRAVQLLALLQRDGRLVDFLTEDVSPYADAQVGAAAREVHQNCRQVLERYLKLEPILGSTEGQPVNVPAGFDPAAIKLVGNVTGRPPMRGVLRHRGWRVSQVHLPPPSQGAGRSVVAPAEVEIE